jgi:hypothetical protein
MKNCYATLRLHYLYEERFLPPIHTHSTNQQDNMLIFVVVVCQDGLSKCPRSNSVRVATHFRFQYKNRYQGAIQKHQRHHLLEQKLFASIYTGINGKNILVLLIVEIVAKKHLLQLVQNLP